MKGLSTRTKYVAALGALIAFGALSLPDALPCTHRIQDLCIEVESISPIEGGVEVYARAWKGNTPLGFIDGTVETEHFRFINPPEYVDDTNGNVVWTGRDRNGQMKERRLRHDPDAALMESLADTIRIVGKTGNVEPGKRGSTTTTIYPDPDPETNTVDGRLTNTGSSDWATVHDAAAGSSIVDNGSVETDMAQSRRSGGGGTNYQIIRPLFYFNTSSIAGTDTISSATFSVYSDSAPDDGDNDGDDWINLVQGQSGLSSDTSLSVNDFDLVGAVSNPTEGATRKDLGTISTGAYNDWTLNATGLGWIARSGETKNGTAGITYLGLREGHDALNSAVADSASNSFIGYFADQGGTTKDPKLVVVHTAGITPAATVDQQVLFF